jgi:hypothetical protein
MAPSIREEDCSSRSMMKEPLASGLSWKVRLRMSPLVAETGVEEARETTAEAVPMLETGVPQVAVRSVAEIPVSSAKALS